MKIAVWKCYKITLAIRVFLLYKLSQLCKNLSKENETRYQLRNVNVFKIPRLQNVRFGKHSIRYLGPYLRSKLPYEKKNCENPFIKYIRRN